ncbi:MAG: SCP2 sterol-binding domain-containing protein [Acidimicrobiia bacterium]|nr:SCP2 sterol-binding domain-containing protein [Acidimicrobiia bacterium]
MSETVDYLGPDWFRQADESVAALSPIPSSVTVAVKVVGLPGDRGDVRYQLVLGPDRVRILPVDGDETDNGHGDATLTMSYDVASAIARGEIGAQRAFLDGEVRLGGDTTALLGHQARLAEIEDRLGDLRSRTTY